MSTATVTSPSINYYKIAQQMQPGEVRVFRDVEWSEYERLHQQLPPDSNLVQVSFSEGVLQLMSTSTLHETYAQFINGLMRLLSLRLRIDIRFFGTATIKKSRKQKGLEPDACFYVQTVPQLGKRLKLDFEVDPPPDVALEVDIYHGSVSKMPIYAALEIPEVWRYDNKVLTIHLLRDGQYQQTESSAALPMLTAEDLTRFLDLMKEKGEFEAMLDFEDWLNSLKN